MILITRPREKAKQLAAQLKKKNINSRTDSLISFYLKNIKINFEPYSDCLIASVQAVNAIKQKHRKEIKHLKKCNHYVIGDEAAKALKALRITKIKKVFHNSDELLNYLSTSTYRIKKLCYLSSNVNNTKLLKKLDLLKVNYKREIIYSVRPKAKLTLKTVNDLRAEHIHVVTLFSLYTAQTYINLVYSANLSKSAEKLVHICLSDDIAIFMRRKGYKKAIASKSPLEYSLIQSVAEFMAKQ